MSVFANIAKIPELRRRILFTLGMLAVYRVGIFVTSPGVDRNVMRKIMQSQSGTFLGMFNLFSGGGSLLGLIVAFVVFSRVMPPVFHAAIGLLYSGIG